MNLAHLVAFMMIAMNSIKVLILSVALASVFIAFSAAMDFNEGGYAKSLHVGNVGYCKSAIKNAADTGQPVSGELLSLCKKELNYE